ncbi:MAG: thrombospondin type-1 domain-containing protein [Patescibacteria group bacterium]
MKSFIQTHIVYLGVFIFLPAFFFVNVPSASAATYFVRPCSSDGDCVNYIYNLTLNESTYSLNEDIVATGTLLQGVCLNRVKIGSDLTALNNRSGSSLKVFSRTSYANWGETGTVTFKAGAGPSPVTSSVTFSATAAFGKDSLVKYTIATIPYRVSASASTVKVNGGLSDWSPCSDQCDQTRSCTNPPPSNGGAACSGQTVRSCTGGACKLTPTPTPTPIPAPTASINSSSSNVSQGDSTTISWNATNVNSCTITRNGVLWQTIPADASGAVSGSSSDTINNQTAYVISCTNSAGEAITATRTVRVILIFKEL